MIVTFQHLRTIPGFSPRPGFCRENARLFCRRHGISLRDFVRNGIAVERLEATGDALALALVKWARECEAKEVADGR